MKQILLSLFVAGSISATAQNWVDKMMTPGVKLEEASESFNDYWQGREYEKGKGHKQFKRWEYFVSRRLNENGTFGNSKELYEALQEWVPVRERNAQSRDLTQRWEPMGPFVNPQGQSGGVGRVNEVDFHPTEDSTIWMGTPAGGAWRTQDNGQSWECMTPYLPGLGVSDVEIDKNNPDVIYIATGDRDAGDTYAFGILKSTDGGQSWNTTGLSFNLASNVRGNRVLIDPRDSEVVLASVSNGIYRSEDGGTNWVKTTTSSTNYSSLERHPSNPDILYAAAYQGSSFIRSTDGGLTWEDIEEGLDEANGARRGQIAVTPANPDAVYIIYCTQQFGYLALFKSTDAGESFTKMSDSPNVLANNTAGTGTGGQGWYDLAIAVSPDDENEIFVGGVNIWKSTDGGETWTINTYWQNFGFLPYSHADHHWLAYHPKTKVLWNGNDGGVFLTEDGGQTWDDVNADFDITQYYRCAVAQTDPNYTLGGAQDNGTDLYTASNGLWRDVNGGDGMNNAISPTDERIMIVSSQYGGMRRSTNAGQSFGSMSGLPTGSGAWITPFEFDPTDPSGLTAYAGFQSLYKSTNGGGSWTPIESPYSGPNLEIVHISKANRDHLIIGDPRTLLMSTDGGDSWFNIKNGFNGTISWVETHPTEEGRIWVTIAGFTAGNKVFYSEDFGKTWTNISRNLPNVPVNCIEIEDNSDDRVYVGTDIGVFYIDNFVDKWQDFNVGLPAVIIDELEIQYSDNVMRAATYGRGMWEIPLLEMNGSPQANFTVNKRAVCIGDSIEFAQGISFGFEKMEWDFDNDGTIDAEGDKVKYAYPEAGIYNIRVIASGANGSDTLIKERYITIEEFTAELASYDTVCANSPVTLTATGGAGYSWSPVDLFTSPYEFTTEFITDKDTTISVFVANAIGCQQTLEMFIDVIDAPELSIENLAAEYCAADSLVEIAFIPEGGDFSGIGFTDSTFSPSEGEFGLRTVNYQYTDEETGCTGFLTQEIYINPEAPTFLNGDVNICVGDEKMIELKANNESAVFSGDYVDSNNFFNSAGLAPGDYTVSLEVANGNACDGTDELVITVRDLPAVKFSNLDNIYCENASLVFVETTPGGSQFEGSGFLSGNRWFAQRAGVGSHELTAFYTDEFGCSNTVVTTVEVVEVPEAAIVEREGNVLTITNAGTNAVYWTDADENIISEEVSIEISENGTYFAFIVNDNDCTSDETETEVTNIALDKINTLNASIFPNPVTDVFTIVLPSSQEAVYKVINVNGEQVLNGNITANQTVVNVDGLSNGAYVVHITSEEGNASFPIIKK